MDGMKATCELCGEPMPPGEDMFKFHGYSGPCPKPPLPAAPVGEPAAMPPEMPPGAPETPDPSFVASCEGCPYPDTCSWFRRCVFRRRTDRKEP